MNRFTCLSIVMLIAAPAAAQQTTPAGGLNSEKLDTVFVQDERGVETKGKLLRLDQQSVTVLLDGQERTFELSNVRRIQKRGDSLKNGAITGAIVGAAIGILSGGFSDCPGGGLHCGAGARVAIAVTSSSIYAAIGTGIDAAIQGRTTLYQRPAATNAPLASGPAVAARFKVSW